MTSNLTASKIYGQLQYDRNVDTTSSSTSVTFHAHMGVSACTSVLDVPASIFMQSGNLPTSPLLQAPNMCSLKAFRRALQQMKINGLAVIAIPDVGKATAFHGFDGSLALPILGFVHSFPWLRYPPAIAARPRVSDKQR